MFAADTATTAYLATDLRYLGKVTILEHEDEAGTFIVQLSDGRKGRVSADQLFFTAQDAKNKATRTLWQM